MTVKHGVQRFLVYLKKCMATLFIGNQWVSNNGMTGKRHFLICVLEYVQTENL